MEYISLIIQKIEIKTLEIKLKKFHVEFNFKNVRYFIIYLFILLFSSFIEPAKSSTQQQQESFLSGTNGLIIVVLLSAFVFVICAAVIKKVFFTAPQAVAVGAPVVAYHNKAMA